MKIGFFANSDFNITTYRLGLIKEAKSRGFEVFAIAPITSQSFVSEIENQGIVFIPVEIARGVGSPFNNFRYIWQVKRICKNYGFDLCHNFTPKCNTLAVFGQKMANVKKIICSVTGLGYVYVSSSLKAKILKLVSNVLYFLSFSFATKVIFQNNDDQEYFIKKRIVNLKKREMISSSGVNLNKFSLNKVDSNKVLAISRQIDKGRGDLVFAYIGRLLKPKGVVDFVEAGRILRKKYSNIKIVLVGIIDRENPDAIFMWEIEVWKRQGDVIYLGERHDVAEILSAIDVFVYPSYYREGVPKSLLEAGAMGKPLIAVNNVGSKDVVVDGVNGFLARPKDPMDLANKMEEFIKNKKLIRQFGDMAHQKVNKEFDEVIVNAKIIDLY